MLTEIEAKKIIKSTAKRSIISYAQKKIKTKSNFQILDLIIPKERKVRNIVGGLETSMGKTLWEPLAKALAKENGFEIIGSKLECPVNMPSNLNYTLRNIIDERKRQSSIYNAESSQNGITQICQSFISRPIESFEKPPRGFGVDIWLKKDNVNYFFDTKTVQPNIGSYSKFLEQVLTWYAYFYSRYPEQRAECRIVFPYNPHNGNFWEHTKGKGRPLEQDKEAWVENQFWDFCSGLENTYELIKEAFIELRKSGELENELRDLLK